MCKKKKSRASIGPILASRIKRETTRERKGIHVWITHVRLYLTYSTGFYSLPFISRDFQFTLFIGLAGVAMVILRNLLSILSLSFSLSLSLSLHLSHFLCSLFLLFSILFCIRLHSFALSRFPYTPLSFHPTFLFFSSLSSNLDLREEKLPDRRIMHLIKTFSAPDKRNFVSSIFIRTSLLNPLGREGKQGLSIFINFFLLPSPYHPPSTPRRFVPFAYINLRRCNPFLSTLRIYLSQRACPLFFFALPPILFFHCVFIPPCVSLFSLIRCCTARIAPLGNY